MTTDAAVLLQAAFSSYPENVAPPGYLYGKEILSDPSGLHVEIYRRSGSSDYIVAFRGTEPTQFNDLTADLNLGWPQYESGRADIQRILISLLSEGGKVDVTGHSLGGALAQFAVYELAQEAKKNGYEQILNQVSLTTWNALGGVWGLQRNGDYDPSIVTGLNARHYYRSDDLVSRLGKGHVGGEMLRLDDPDNRIAGVLEAHMQDELSQSLLAGTISEAAPQYFQLHDTSQMVAGDLAMGLLKLFKQGESLAGVLQIASAAMTLAQGSIPALAEDLGQLLGDAYLQQGHVLLRDQGPQLVAAIWELGRLLGETLLPGTDLQIWNLQRLLLGNEALIGASRAASSLPGRLDLTAFETLLHGRLARVTPFSCPLVLDLGGDGLRTLSLATSGVRFDLDANGVPEATGWIDPTEGLLVRDRNGNGRIDSGLELFGDHTLLSNGTRAAHGFEALAELDANRDGQIDRRDTAWGDLGLWRDSDSDGQLDAGEWLSLAAADIATLDLAYSSGTGPDAQGNELRLAGQYRRGNGERRLLADVWLASDGSPARMTPLLATTPLTATAPLTATTPAADLPAGLQDLPELAGLGHVGGLQNSVRADSSGRLAQQLQAWIAADRATRPSLMPEILMLWAGVADRPATAIGGLTDGRRLAVLHAFSNDQFVGRNWDLNSPGNIALLNATFDDLCRWVGHLLSSRDDLSPLWSQAICVRADGLAGVDGPSVDLALQDQFQRSTDDAQLIAAGQALRSHPLVSDALLAALRERAMEQLSQPDRRLWLLLVPQTRQFALRGGWSWSQAEAELLELGPGETTLDGGGGDDVLIGSAGADSPCGGAGNDLILGGDGNDSITTSEGNDTICAGRGNDSIHVGRGQGLIVVNPGDGQDRITTTTLDPGDPAAGQSFSLRFNGSLNAESIRIRRLQHDLLISFLGSSDALTLAGYFDQSNPWDSRPEANSLRQISFANGLSWDGRQLMEQAIRGSSGNDDLQGWGLDETIHGGSGDDRLRGWGGSDHLWGDSGADTLEGSLGQTTLSGGSGNDTFLLEEGINAVTYNLGDGFETLHGNSRTANNDLLLGAGITPGDLIPIRNGDDLILSLPDPNTGIRLSSFFYKTWCSPGDSPIGNIHFQDGNDWDWQALKDTLLRGNDADNRITGFSNDDSLWGEAGNDILIGRDGNDRLLGGSGNDTLNGEAGSDRLEGGAGNDTLYCSTIGGEDILAGGSGRNVFSYYRGNAVLSANLDPDESSFNTLTFHTVFPDNVIVSRQGNTLLLTCSGYGVPGSSTIKVEDFFRDFTVLNRWNPLQVISFGSLGTWDARTVASTFSNAFMGTSAANRLSGRDSDDWLDGMEANDLLQGLAGHDTLQGGSGNDTLIGGAGNDLLLGSDGLDTASWAGTATPVRADLSLSGPQDTDTGRDTLLGIDHLIGGSSHDQLLGDASANRLDGGDGDDSLDGGGGNDTLLGGNHLSGDTASYARAVAAVMVNLALTSVQNTGGAGSDLLSGLENVIGSSYADNLIGNSGSNRIEGGGGNDTLQGGAGVDSLIGGTGADLFMVASPAEAGNGNGSRDWILDLSVEDRLDLSSIDARSDLAGNQAFDWIGSAPFSGLGQLRYTRLNNGNGLLEGNCSGSLAADLQLELSGNPDLASGALAARRCCAARPATRGTATPRAATAAAARPAPAPSAGSETPTGRSRRTAAAAPLRWQRRADRARRAAASCAGLRRCGNCWAGRRASADGRAPTAPEPQGATPGPGSRRRHPQGDGDRCGFCRGQIPPDRSVAPLTTGWG